MRTDYRRCIRVVEFDKKLKHETLFDEGIIRAVTDVVQYEGDLDDDPVKVDTAKIPHTEGENATLRYMLSTV